MKMVFFFIEKLSVYQIKILGNGVIDFDEFTDMLDKTKSIADPEADLKEAFKVFDLDGDGIITAKELKLVMHSLGQPVSGSDIEDMIKEADQNCKLI